MRLLFVDAKSSTPYDSEIMRHEGIGGTEATVVRVAEGLARWHDVTVAQLGRTASQTFHERLRYVPLDAGYRLAAAPPDRVVVLRKPGLIRGFAAACPGARMTLWVHNWQRPEILARRHWLARTGCRVVTVSHSHARQTERLLNGMPARLLGALTATPDRIAVQAMHNPIDDALAPDDTPVDRDQLLFCSTANKGLARVLEHYEAVRRRCPSLRLLIAGTPTDQLERALGQDAARLAQPGVEVLGRLSRHDLMAHIRRSLCVFYPQDAHPETFGLIFAEANAVGTPVLAHDFGAAGEVLSSRDQLVDAGNADEVCERLLAWRDGERPVVTGRAVFRTEAVVGRWRELVERDA